MPKNDKAPIMVRVHDGTRQLMPQGKQILFRLIDGNQKKQHEKFHKKPVLRKSVPFFNNLRDLYSVIASSRGHVQAGFHPVPVKPGVVTTVDLMLLPQKNEFNFRDALWDQLSSSHPKLTKILSQGVTETKARDRYTQLMEKKPDCLAAFLNMMTALEQVPFSTGTALDHLKTLIWNDANAPITADRFFGFAAKRLIRRLEIAKREGSFEDAPSALHPGATRSFKQVEFGEANLQVTLHEKDKRVIDGTDCVKVEFDMDYFKDTLSHLFLEVLVNKFGRRTDPRVVYVLRWMAGRQADRPEFEPPYTIRAA